MEGGQNPPWRHLLLRHSVTASSAQFGCLYHLLGNGLVAVPDGLQEPFACLLVFSSTSQPVPLLLQRRHFHAQQRDLWAEGRRETQGCSDKFTTSRGEKRATGANLEAELPCS